MMAHILKYPIGQQNFKNLRDANCVYIDKTGYIEKIINSGDQYYFLARPRRFGKSLFLSALEYFFKDLLMDLVGLDTETESATSDGSTDITIKTEDYIYVIELKYDGSAEMALRQILDRQYACKFQTDGRKIISIGVNFSSKTRCIENWIVRE